MVVSTKTAKGEQRKLTATFFNNGAVGCVLLGLIGPLSLSFRLTNTLGGYAR